MIVHRTRKVVTRPWPLLRPFGARRRQLHEGRAVLDVSLGERDHVIQVLPVDMVVGAFSPACSSMYSLCTRLI